MKLSGTSLSFPLNLEEPILGLSVAGYKESSAMKKFPLDALGRLSMGMPHSRHPKASYFDTDSCELKAILNPTKL